MQYTFEQQNRAAYYKITVYTFLLTLIIEIKVAQTTASFLKVPNKY